MFMDSPSFWLKHSELRSSSSKLSLRIKQFGIVAYAFALFSTTFLETAVYRSFVGLNA